MAKVQGLGKVRAVISLSDHHERFISELIVAVRKRTGITLTRSGVLRVLIEAAMALDVTEADLDDAYVRVCGLETLRKTRDSIRREIKQTELDLGLVMTERPVDNHAVEHFRRNLAYQMRRLAAAEVQISQWERPPDGGSNGVARILQALLCERLNP